MGVQHKGILTESSSALNSQQLSKIWLIPTTLFSHRQIP